MKCLVIGKQDMHDAEIESHLRNATLFATLLSIAGRLGVSNVYVTLGNAYERTLAADYAYTLLPMRKMRLQLYGRDDNSSAITNLIKTGIRPIDIKAEKRQELLSGISHLLTIGFEKSVPHFEGMISLNLSLADIFVSSSKKTLPLVFDWLR